MAQRQGRGGQWFKQRKLEASKSWVVDYRSPEKGDSAEGRNIVVVADVVAALLLLLLSAVTGN